MKFDKGVFALFTALRCVGAEVITDGSRNQLRNLQVVSTPGTGSDFEMYSAGKGGGFCESGYEVTQEQCLDAAHTTGVGMTLTTTVLASDWATTPCGCFIFNEQYVNYKDPVHGNCLDQEYSRLVCQAGGTIFPTFEMYPAGEEGSGICASGFEVTEEECLAAAHRTGLGMTLTTDLRVNNFAGLPCGCFVYNDSYVNYKDPAHGSCAAQGSSELLCREGGKPFELYSAGVGGGSCESGYEVTQEQCLDAAHTTGVGMTLTAEVMASDWDTTPCGCFIFNEEYVNYKDPVHGNCLDQEYSRLVCQAGGTIFPTFEMYPAGEEGSGICPSGFEVIEEECLAAAHRTGGSTGLGMTLRTDLTVSNFVNFPCGCFVYNDSFVNYKDPANGSCAAQVSSKLLCREGSKSFELYSAGEGGGICESGYEVTQAQCLDAAHEAGEGMTLTSDDMAYDGPTTPCGCFIFNEQYVNYKDPVHGNCVDQEISRLVCLIGGIVFSNYEMYPAGEIDSGICASGYEVTEEECLEAAHRTGVGMTLKTNLGFPTFANLPCGCFVYNGSYVNYKDPANGSCAAQNLSNLVCHVGGKNFEIYSAGEGGGVCKPGYEVTQAQCLDAAHENIVGMTLRDSLVVNDMDTTPCGCFVFNQWVNYKDPAHGNCLDNSSSKLVCREGGRPDAVVIPESVIYPAGEGGGSCESGYELTEEQCLDAAHETGVGMTLKPDLVINDWDTTPCGCFIFNQWVNYKDPAHGNCIDHTNSRLVCIRGPEFEIYADEEGGGVCTSGKAVTQEECFAAGHEVGIGMNLGDELIVYDWDWTPCGCFIYDNFLVDYKDPVHGSCTHHAKCKSVCRKQVGTQTETVNANPVTPPPYVVSDFEVHDKNIGVSCSSGFEVTVDECYGAAHEAADPTLVGEVSLRNKLSVGTWALMPCGCFIYKDYYVNFKDPSNGNCAANAGSSLVCRKGGVTLAQSANLGQYATNAYEVIAEEEDEGICVSGKEVIKHHCLDAAHEVGVGMDLRNTVMVGDWDWTPCGCFIYNDKFVDYKDPALGNCKAHADTKLVCRKVVVTVGIERKL